MTDALDLDAVVQAVGPRFAEALETAGGVGFYRRTGLERLLRDAHGAQFHPLSAKRQQVFTGRVALGLDPIADAA
jgi:alkylation response protein AidB-like acyl-CoA dehydrogenase